LAVGALISVFNPGYITPLFDHPTGRFMLTGAIMLQIVGFIIIQKIVKIKVR